MVTYFAEKRKLGRRDKTIVRGRCERRIREEEPKTKPTRRQPHRIIKFLFFLLALSLCLFLARRRTYTNTHSRRRQNKWGIAHTGASSRESVHRVTACVVAGWATLLHPYNKISIKKEKKPRWDRFKGHHPRNASERVLGQWTFLPFSQIFQGRRNSDILGHTRLLPPSLLSYTNQLSRCGPVLFKPDPSQSGRGHH